MFLRWMSRARVVVEGHGLVGEGGCGGGARGRAEEGLRRRGVRVFAVWGEVGMVGMEMTRGLGLNGGRRVVRMWVEVVLRRWLILVRGRIERLD